MSEPRVAVVQFPGVNCERETAQAIARVGLEPEVFRWRRPAGELRDYQAYVLPGGFSYQDRVRAGALAAKDPIVDVLAEEADRGKPVLGICNGAQVLVEAGLVPGGGRIELGLARNRMPRRSGYHARWVHVRVEASPCVFTRALPVGTVLPLPVAHAEGRFVGERGRMDALVRHGQVPLRYAGPGGEVAVAFPDNPNGSEAAAAAVCDGRGNVMALMPHPERAQEVGMLSRSVGGAWSEARERWCETAQGSQDGPGLVIFRGLAQYLKGS